MVAFTPATPAEAAAFLAHLQKLLDAENTLELAQSSLLHSSCPPKLLEKQGLALNNLGVASVSIGLGGKTLVELERPSAWHTEARFPSHTFRTGDLAAVVESASGGDGASSSGGKSSKGGAGGSAGKRVEGVIAKVSDSKIVMAVDGDRKTGSGDEGKGKVKAKVDDLDIPEKCRLIKLANTVVYDRMTKTLDALRKLFPSDDTPAVSSSSKNQSQLSLSPLIAVLLSLSPPTKPQPSQSKEIAFLDPTLNPSQREAVRLALEQPEVAIIQGPPGTGKTWTAIEIIRQLVEKEGKRVLVCGGSNLAVDNLLERLVPYKIPLLRLGHPARVLPTLLTTTLDYAAVHSSAGQIVKDVKTELETTLSDLTRGKIRGKARKEKWEEVRELRKEYRKREGAVVKNVVGQAKVVLCTCHGAGSRQIQNEAFDVVLIDEAAQAVEPACWIPILKGKKLILAGDHLQLPPTVKSINSKDKSKTPGQKSSSKDTKKPRAKKESKKSQKEVSDKKQTDEKDGNGEVDKDEDESDSGTSSLGAADVKAANKPDQKQIKPKKPLPLSKTLETTLFDRLVRLHGNNLKRMLAIQYRMHETICAFPSKALYHGILKSDESVKHRLLKDLPGVEESAEALSEPVVFIDTAGTDMYERVEDDEKITRVDSESKSNENEATLVVAHVQELILAKVPPSSIAIISPYNAQVALLSSLLLSQYPDLEIGSVDGFQGREKDAVIVSLVRSNPEREVGFLKEKRRLNVAMTRPRRHLCIVGDSQTVSNGSSYLKSYMDWLEESADVRMAGMES